MKNDFESRKEKRISRYKELAEKNEDLSTQQFKRASEMASVIPFGQPILVGHHSEKRDRNYRAKINGLQDKAMASSNKAQYYAEKAAIAESNTSISSDDPQAIEKLTEKLEAMQQLQELMKAANKIIKNEKLSEAQKIEKLAAHNIKEKYAIELIKPDYCNRTGFPGYRLTNNNANIKRVKDRISKLKSIEKLQSHEITINGVRIYMNVQANRLQMFFPGKPEDSIRTSLKSNGFRWSPSEGAWQRHISNSATYAAKEIANKLKPQDTKQISHRENLHETETIDNGPTGHGDICYSDADPGL